VSTFFQQLVNGLSLGSIYALIALGYTMVYGILRLINFAHGDVYMVGAYMGYYASSRFRGSEPSYPRALGIMLLSMVVCGLLGVVIERFAYRPVRRAAKMTSLITAIGVSLLLENGGQLLFGADPKFFPSTAPHREFNVGGVRITSEQLTVFVVSIVLTIFLLAFIQKTRTGKAMRAVSFNLDAAKLMGISTDKIIAITFALGSAFAAAAGVLVAMAIPKIDPLMGIMSGLKAFVAAVLGGIGNVPGAMVGGVLIGLIEAMGGQFIATAWTDVIIFSILVLVLVFKPAGLFGRIAPNKS
jgi:branched-chain amino acid transport system permease protein